MAAVIAFKELVEKFCKVAGLEFSWIKQKREMKECQQSVKRELAELQEKHDSFEEDYRKNIRKRDEFNEEIRTSIGEIKTEITKMNKETERREAEKKFENLRDNIISFANDLPNKKTVSEEIVENMYKKINFYHKLEKEYGFANSQAPVSIEVITRKYQEMLMNGQITKGKEN